MHHEKINLDRSRRAFGTLY